MVHTNRKIVVFNATGAQGGAVVEAALSAGLAVRAVARNHDPLRRYGDRVEPHPVDLGDPHGIAAVLEGAQGAFFHLPRLYDEALRTAYLGNVLEAATRTGLPVLVFSSSGHAAPRFGSSPVVLANGHAVETVLASRVPAVVLEPTVYLENLWTTPLVPKLRTEGILDYPPLATDRPFAWTTLQDQADLAVAAFSRPQLVGRRFEIGNRAVTGPQLAGWLGTWLGREVRYQATSPQEFGVRLTQLTGSDFAGRAVESLYAELAALPPEGTRVDVDALEQTFAVRLESIEAQIRRWPTPRY